MNRRTLIPLISIVLALVGCAASVPGTPMPASASATSSAAPTVADVREPPRFAPPVLDPKDARGIAPCDLLTDAQLVELGLIPESANETLRGTAQSCSWTSSLDDTNPAGLQIDSNTTIAALDTLYLLRDQSARFEPTEVAGHPAVRSDYAVDNTCTLYTGIADYQAVSTKYNVANRPLPDPCDIPRRMAEFILSNLPPLT